MSAGLGFRWLIAVSALLGACSQPPDRSNPSASQGGSSDAAQGGNAQGGALSVATSAGGSPGASSAGGSGGRVASATGGASGGRVASASGGADSVAGSAGAGAGGSDSAAGADGSDSSGGAAGTGAHQPGSSILTTVTWKAVAQASGSNLYLNVPAAASLGNEAAVAYVERTSTSGMPTTGRVVMQRFDSNGEPRGSLLVLANNPGERSTVTLASDGRQYAVCWDETTVIRCSMVNDQGFIERNILGLPGQNATIVARANGWAIAYTGSDKRLRMQLLSSLLQLDGGEVDPQLFTYPSPGDQTPLFVATPSGYVLVGSETDSGPASLVRFNSDLQQVVAPIALARGLWFASQLVASETRAAVSLSAPYGSYLLVLSRDRLTAEVLIAGGGKAGTSQALLMTDGGIAAAWLTPDGGVRRRFFADGHDDDIGIENRRFDGALLGMPEEGTDSYQQLVDVAGQPLLVARAIRYGAFYDATALRVAPLTFP